jgi:hypothetical protein
MAKLDDLLSRIQKRVSDPLRFLDAAAWVRPTPKISAPASPQDVTNAETLFGFSFPIVLRRMYTEIGNGRWGPYYGFEPIATDGAKPTENDLVGYYLECISEEHALVEPLVQWPRGMVTVIGRGCVSYELCDFIRAPHAVYLLSGDTWLPNTPVLEALTLVAESIEDRLDQWLQS